MARFPMRKPPPRPPVSGKAKLAAVVGAASLGLIAVVAQFEGKSNDPYLDRLAYNIPTVCYGETNVPMRRYSNEECSDMLAESLAGYGAAVLERNPNLRGHDPQVLAATSLTYNVGIGAYNRSTVARHFEAGRWRSACNGFLAWNRAGGRVVAGLAKRREAERRICLRDIPAEFDR